MNQLKSIARRVMTERGLLPDFSAAVVAEVSALREGPATSGPGIRDLRDLRWASIDRVRVKLVHTDVERGFIDFARTVAA